MTVGDPVQGYGVIVGGGTKARRGGLGLGGAEHGLPEGGRDLASVRVDGAEGVARLGLTEFRQAR
jgi:hypothetical protein